MTKYKFLGPAAHFQFRHYLCIRGHGEVYPSRTWFGVDLSNSLSGHLQIYNLQNKYTEFAF